MDSTKVLSAKMFQKTNRSKKLILSTLTYRMTGEPRSIERRLWVDETIADHIPYTWDDQNQTIGGCLQEVVYVLCKLRVEKFPGGLVDITSLNLLITRV